MVFVYGLSNFDQPYPLFDRNRGKHPLAVGFRNEDWSMPKHNFIALDLVYGKQGGIKPPTLALHPVSTGVYEVNTRRVGRVVFEVPAGTREDVPEQNGYFALEAMAARSTRAHGATGDLLFVGVVRTLVLRWTLKQTIALTHSFRL
jgi:hypothetical protein